jgi:hypothetical protein
MRHRAIPGLVSSFRAQGKKSATETIAVRKSRERERFHHNYSTFAIARKKIHRHLTNP